MISLEIARLPITNNKRHRKHWAELQRDFRGTKKKPGGWVSEVFSALCISEGPILPPAASGNRRVRIILHVKRAQDHDNAMASCKPVLDALTENRLIVDDKPECIGKPVVEQVISRRSKTVIEIYTEEDLSAGLKPEG